MTHAVAPRRFLASPHLNDGSYLVEVFLLLWDEMDDWVGAARHLLRGLTVV